MKDGRASLLVLDVMLPGIDGLEVSTRLREEGPELPILMVTARDAENDRCSASTTARTTT